MKNRAWLTSCQLFVLQVDDLLEAKNNYIGAGIFQGCGVEESLEGGDVIGSDQCLWLSRVDVPGTYERLQRSEGTEGWFSNEHFRICKESVAIPEYNQDHTNPILSKETVPESQYLVPTNAIHDHLLGL